MLQLKFASDTCHLGQMRDTVRAYLDHCEISEMDTELVVLALDEACTNVIRYAYLGARRRPIRLELKCADGRLECTIRDYGKSCDPTKIKGRDLTDFRPGGLGVRIMHTAFDKVDFKPMPRGTCLHLTKKLPASTSKNSRAKPR